MGRKNAGLKVQVQAYNVFNEVQFTNLNATYTFTGTNNSQNSNTTLESTCSRAAVWPPARSSHA